MINDHSHHDQPAAPIIYDLILPFDSCSRRLSRHPICTDLQGLSIAWDMFGEVSLNGLLQMCIQRTEGCSSMLDTANVNMYDLRGVTRSILS
jgi:hypothetical protein